MNKIICDNQECKAEIPMTKDLIETKHLSGGVQINFFRCGKCNSKTLIDVTDRKIRAKQYDLRTLGEVKAVLYKNLEKGLHSLEFAEKEAEKLDNQMKELQTEIKEAKAELKVKYEEEL